jgi:hypothetical protein
VANGTIAIQKPPTAQNYAIGCSASRVTGSSSGLSFLTCPFNEPEGYIEGTNTSGLEPASLFAAQLSERLYGPSSVGEAKASLTPKAFRLYQNYPNPFNPKTVINYELPVANDVELSVYNLLGEKVETLFAGQQHAGAHQVQWNAAGYASGIYYYYLKAGLYQESRKMILLK